MICSLRLGSGKGVLEWNLCRVSTYPDLISRYLNVSFTIQLVVERPMGPLSRCNLFLELSD